MTMDIMDKHMEGSVTATFCEAEASGICDIIDGTIDTIREWEPEEEVATGEISYWINILEKLNPKRAERWK